MIFLENKEKILVLGKLISDKKTMFEVVLSEFKEVKPEFESSFNEYKNFKQNIEK